MKLKKNEQGFSFIELVIVVAVVGILTAIAVPSYGAIQDNARQAAVDAASTNGYTASAAALVLTDKQTPAQALEKLSNETIELSFLSSTGAPIAEPANEDFCVRAVNTTDARNSANERYISFTGECAEEGETPGGTDPGTDNPTPPVEQVAYRDICDDGIFSVPTDVKVDCERSVPAPNSGGIDAYTVTITTDSTTYVPWQLDLDFTNVDTYKSFRAYGGNGTVDETLHSTDVTGVVVGADRSWNGAPASFGNYKFVKNDTPRTFTVQVAKDAPLAS